MYVALETQVVHAIGYLTRVIEQLGGQLQGIRKPADRETMQILCRIARLLNHLALTLV